MPGLADNFLLRYPFPGAGLPSADLPPSTVWGGLMPGSAEEWAHLRPDLRTFLPGFQGGHDLARGIGEGNLGLAGWGAAQVALPFAAFRGLRPPPTTRPPPPTVAPGPSPPTALPPPVSELPPWTQPTGLITGAERSSARSMAAADAVQDVLERVGATNINRYSAGGRTRSRYLEFGNPYGPAGGQATVRIPSDTHPSPRRGGNSANFFDTGVSSGAGQRNPTLNAAGGRFQNWENLIDVLRWRLSADPRGGNWLVAPGREPRGLDRARRPGAEPPPAGPHPDQLRLLGAGAGTLGLPSFMESEGGSEAWRRLVPGLGASVTIGG